MLADPPPAPDLPPPYPFSRTQMMHRAALIAILFVWPACSRGEEREPAQQVEAKAPTSPGGPAAAPVDETVVLRRLVYVPVYSHIYHRDGRRSLDLTVTLSLRNTDPQYQVTVRSVRYYDTAGKLVRSYLQRPLPLAPMETREIIVGESESRGGSGANFLVEWTAARSVTEPVIETVMIGTVGGQGISFTSIGRTLVRE